MVSLISNSNTYASRSIRPSRPSSNFRMPHVFIIPPEEEQQDNPPWCCFAADGQPENNDDFPSTPDIHFLDDPYLFQQHEHGLRAPIARRTSVHKPRPRALMPKKLEKKQRPEAIKIVENKPSHPRHRDAREDLDVVEVVKVKRCRETLTDLEENINVKRSKTLRSRASKALQSIKNVGRPSHRTHVKELWTSSESMPGIFKGVQERIRSQQDQTEHRSPATPTEKGSLSRGNSRSLSQFFQPVKPTRPESSFTMRVPSSVAPAEPHRVPTANPSTLPRLRNNNRNPSLNEALSTLTIDDAFNRPVSPKSSMKKHTNRKFSVRELHRLFTFSSSSPDDPSSVPTTTASLSSTHGNSMPSTSTSPLSSDYPDVLMEEDIFADAHFIDLDKVDRSLASPHPQASYTRHGDKLTTPRRLSDLSFEMRLDSFHFDSLSFDPEDFDVSMEGNVLW